MTSMFCDNEKKLTEHEPGARYWRCKECYSLGEKVRE